MTLKTVEIIRADVEVEVVVPDQGDLYSALAARGVAAHVLAFPRLRRWRGLRSWLHYFGATAMAMGKFWRLLRQRRPALVHFSEIIDAPFLIVAPLALVPAVAHVRCILPGWGGRLFRLLALGAAKRVLCESAATRAAMFPRPHKRVTVLYAPGPDPVFLNPPVPMPSDDGPLRVIAVAKFVAAKGHKGLLEVFHELRKTGIPAQLTIVGRRQEGHEPYHDACLDFIRRHDLHEHVEMIPYLQPAELAAAMDRAHLLAHLPAYHDPLPGVVFEAMARARAVLAYDCGGIGEQFEHGVSGLLIPHGDQAAAVSTLRSLAGARHRLRALGHAARKHLETHFSYQRYRRELLAIYREVLHLPTETP